MNLPGDQALLWTGQEDLLHSVLPINCSDTLVDETMLASPEQWAHYDGDSHTYYHVKIAEIFLFSRFSLCYSSQFFLTDVQMHRVEEVDVVIQQLFNLDLTPTPRFTERHLIDL